VIEIRQFLTEQGRSPYREWFLSLDNATQVRIEIAIQRLELGNTSGLKSVGAGVLEQRIHFGPGYRLYLGRDGAQAIILLAGGSKQHQQRDIERAKKFWEQYKRYKNLARRRGQSGRR
jgi:putative addiction module killer protein